MSDDDVFLSRRISLKAKGLYVQMRAMKKSGRSLEIKTIVEITGEAKSVIDECLRELAKAELIAIENSQRDEESSVGGSISIIERPGEQDENGSSKVWKKPPRARIYPSEFIELCELSLRPIEAADFRADCYGLWEKRIDEGYAPEQIKDAYVEYIKAYRSKNGDDTRYAKNLASWLMRPGGLVTFAGEPVCCRAVGSDGHPLSREQLADVFGRFGKVYSNERSIRASILSGLLEQNLELTDELIEDALGKSDLYERYADKCDVLYIDYLYTVDPDDKWGMRAREGERKQARQSSYVDKSTFNAMQTKDKSGVSPITRFDGLTEKLVRSISASRHAQRDLQQEGSAKAGRMKQKTEMR